MWFEATEVNEHHLFCAEYCGTYHSGMIGKVHVLRKEDYDRWLDRHAEGSPALEGRKLFLKLQCVACHHDGTGARAPSLAGLYDQTVVLRDGQRVRATDGYLRESILRPRAQVVAGWEPIMPSYQGRLADEKAGLGEAEAVNLLIAYIRSLHDGRMPVRTDEFPPPADDK
jgi:cytochrome c oxidase subunit 2